MKRIQKGKTKDILEAEDGNIQLLFKDDVTGTGNQIDPGGDSVVGKVEGKGNASLRISQHFFELLKDEGIPNHYIDVDFGKNTMLVKRAETFGAGLEFVCRLKATGSFIRRYGKYASEGQELDYLVEITLKDDEKGDPLLNDDTIIQLNLMTKEEIEETKNLTKEITKLIKKECGNFDLELIDIKFEFGRIDGKIAVIDEISGDNMRVRKDGKPVMQNELWEIICK
ncbi:MAG TPA: phosphoribosylaminoimidazolesuccinocarboxamide synthase [Thermoanaerobacterales bacterium]|nr:phosphoribosylaminoimidazolesuccinocarboxamide synthase [Thermoanaerobacterales bacterium]